MSAATVSVREGRAKCWRATLRSPKWKRLSSFLRLAYKSGTRRHSSAFVRKRELNQILRISMDGASPWGGGCTRCSRVTLRKANGDESADNGVDSNAIEMGFT